MEMFEQASRLKLRFASPAGSLGVEDLWDLPLSAAGNRPSLDSIAVALHRLTRDAAETVSFVKPSTADAAVEEAQLKFAVVKHIIDVRIAERDELKLATDRRAKKERLLELIARKEDAALGEKSVEELRALAESL